VSPKKSNFEKNNSLVKINKIDTAADDAAAVSRFLGGIGNYSQRPFSL
jgi:hypothetical protein